MSGLAVAGDDAETLFRRVAARYSRGDRFTRHYVASKLRRDPVHRDLMEYAAAIPSARAGEARAPLGLVLDLGCGRGQTGLLLLEACLAASVVGLERDARHVAQALLAGQRLPFRADIHDLTMSVPLPEADTILLIDVLYQLPTDAQRDLLRRATVAARHRLFIRTLDPDRGARSVFARAAERLFRRVWPNAGSHVNPRPVADLVADLAGYGFGTEEVPCWRGTPFANVLLVARRASEAA